MYCTAFPAAGAANVIVATPSQLILEVPMNRSTLRVFVALSALALSAAACAPADEEAPLTDAAAVDTMAAPADTPAAATDGLIDPDQATTEQLTAIDGIDEALAAQIVAGRPYDNMLEVDSILAGQLDETQREAVYGHLWKRIDLNTASAEEILLIPNLGDRMLHEFEEYRPYRAIEEFRREMGKYVDDAEVARLESYVEVR